MSSKPSPFFSRKWTTILTVDSHGRTTIVTVLPDLWQFSFSYMVLILSTLPMSTSEECTSRILFEFSHTCPIIPSTIFPPSSTTTRTLSTKSIIPSLDTVTVPAFALSLSRTITVPTWDTSPTSPTSTELITTSVLFPLPHKIPFPSIPTFVLGTAYTYTTVTGIPILPPNTTPLLRISTKSFTTMVISVERQE